jgi:hypothetical protein
MNKLLIAFAASTAAFVFSAGAIAGSSGSPPKPADHARDLKISASGAPAIPSAILAAPKK